MTHNSDLTAMKTNTAQLCSQDKKVLFLASLEGGRLVTGEFLNLQCNMQLLRPASTTAGPLRELPCCMREQGPQSTKESLCYTSNGRQVDIRLLYERRVVSPGITYHPNVWAPEGCLDLSSEGPRVKRAAIWAAPVTAWLQHWPA